MAYNNILANRVREYLSEFKELEVEEKKIFGGLAFMVLGLVYFLLEITIIVVIVYIELRVAIGLKSDRVLSNHS